VQQTEAMNMLSKIAVYLVLVWALALFGGQERSFAGDQPSERCDKWEGRPLPSDKHGRTVIVVEEGCSGFANGASFSIDLVFSDGTRTTIFKYEDASWNAAYYGQTTPVIEWVGDNHLRISIGTVTAVQRKVEKLRDVRIDYNIGHVLDK